MTKGKTIKSNFISNLLVAIFLFAFIFFSPFMDYINSKYGDPRECTVEYARFGSGGSGSRVASTKNKMWIETLECGPIITYKVKGGTDDLLKNIYLVNQYQGQKLVFMIGPLSWSPGNTRAEYVIIPENTPQ